MHFLSRTAAALALSGACFLAGSDSALAAQTASLSVDATPSESSASISPLLYGIFLEDINFAVDGGMYTELIKNGSKLLLLGTEQSMIVNFLQPILRALKDAAGGC